MGYYIYGWRHVPVDITCLGEKANATRPEIEQILIRCEKDMDQEKFERELYIIRRRIEKAATAAGIAVGVGGIFRDILAGMASRNYFGADLNSPATGYCGVYLLEIILLCITIAAMTNFRWPAKPIESAV